MTQLGVFIEQYIYTGGGQYQESGDLVDGVFLVCKGHQVPDIVIITVLNVMIVGNHAVVLNMQSR